MLRNAAFLALALSLAGCGLSPVYSGGSASAPAVLAAQVAIAPIPDRAGFLVREALLDRLGQPTEVARYRLEVELDDQIVGFGVRGDNSVARERRTLRARYRLVEASTNTVVVDATAGSDAGIDRVSSNFAVVAAETTALERLSTEIARQIAARLALYARTAAPTAGLAAAK
ncbi:LPS assembly lipoprotein LptE [Sandarakinorhabdus sp. DWP1-3-1]|uniref:LPS assembly lipoprotein LptE n=1 Tax=Sandarakinorhabdus sp. DWP1-3-1 TaxID=2804627 RepID=UPI003CF1A3EF